MAIQKIEAFSNKHTHCTSYILLAMNPVLENVCIYIKGYCSKAKECCLEWYPFLIRTFGVYFMWIFIHYISAKLYITWCVPAGLTGFILAFIYAPSPHCNALRWAIYNGGNSISAMWILFGTWVISYIVPIKQ